MILLFVRGFYCRFMELFVLVLFEEIIDFMFWIVFSNKNIIIVILWIELENKNNSVIRNCDMIVILWIELWKKLKWYVIVYEKIGIEVKDFMFKD